MAEETVRYPLDDFDWPPPPTGEPGVSITHLRGLACCQVFAWRGQDARVQATLGVATSPGRLDHCDGMEVLPLAPRQWMMVSPRGRDGDFAEALALRLRGMAQVSDQSHGRAVLRVSGPGAIDLLAAECRLDLDAFGAACVAQTVLAETSVLMWRPVDVPGFRLMLYPGYTRDFIERLQQAAAPLRPLFNEETIA